MFGYVKPRTAELTVRQNEYYRALYCGLCHTMGARCGDTSRFTLSYDFVFLALLRSVFDGDAPETERRRCMAHPMKKRGAVKRNAALEYTAQAASVLTYHKILDDLADEHGRARLRAKLAYPAARQMLKKSQADAELCDAVMRGLDKLAVYESEKRDSLDGAADAFGDVLAPLFSYGLDGTNARIAAEIGRVTGKIIYVLDAADDISDDAQRGRYNPLLLVHSKSAIAEITRAADKKTHDKNKKYMLASKVGEELYQATVLELMKLEAAVNLIDFGDWRNSEAIVKNIVYLGLPDIAKRIFLGEDGTDNISDK